MKRAARATTDLTSADARIKAREIHERRAACHDPALGHFPDDRYEDPYLIGVVAYARRYRNDVPLADLIEDDCAALLITDYLRRRLDQHDCAAITRAKRAGATWTRLGAALRLTRQGAEQYHRRLLSAEQPGGGPRSEVAARRDLPRLDDQNRMPADTVPSRYTPTTSPQQLYDLARDLVAARRLIPEPLAEEVDNVKVMSETMAGALSAIRILLAELRAHPGPLDPALQGLVDRGTMLVTR